MFLIVEFLFSPCKVFFFNFLKFHLKEVNWDGTPYFCLLLCCSSTLSCSQAVFPCVEREGDIRVHSVFFLLTSLGQISAFPSFFLFLEHSSFLFSFSKSRVS